MSDNRLEGRLGSTPFARVLFEIWQKERSGRLRLIHEGAETSLFFERGRLCVESETFPEEAFAGSLLKRRLLGSDVLADCRSFADLNNGSLLKAMLELQALPSYVLWPLLEAFVRENVYPIFDWEEGEFGFDRKQFPAENIWLRGIDLPGLILEGIRRMENQKGIEAQLPPEDELLEAKSPYYADSLDLHPQEEYLLALVESAGSPKEIAARSLLSRKEARRILYALIILGLVGPAQPKNKNHKPVPEFSGIEMERILGAFNDRCAYVFKYISKELGPVALNVLEKSLEEVKGHLDPSLHRLSLRPDGRIDPRTFLKMNLGISGEEGRKNFLRSLDEILGAEVLAVKKTLGNAHEALLVKNLEKLGETG
jgi:hypothetical protein